MQIQSINNFSNIKNNQNPQFKSVYPVVHWLAETNGSFSPQIKINIARELNENIISRLNVNRLKVEQKIAELTKKISELTEKIKTARSEREKVAKEKKIAKFDIYEYIENELKEEEEVSRETNDTKEQVEDIKQD